MPSLKRIFTLRLHDDDYEKIKLISFKSNRSMCNYIEYLVINCIDKYEKKHGIINIDYDYILSKTENKMIK